MQTGDVYPRLNPMNISSNGSSICKMILVVAMTLAAGACRDAARGPVVITPHERAVSELLPTTQNQSAAIWIHPTEPAKSLLFIPNAMRGLQVHRLDGSLVSNLSQVRNSSGVGIIYNFSNNGTLTDLVLAGTSKASSTGNVTNGVLILKINPAGPDVSNDGAFIETSQKPSSDNAAPSVLCTYRSHVTGRRYFLVVTADGVAEQWEIIAKEDHVISAKKTRTLSLGGEIAGCVADDDAGVIFMADRKAGIRQFNAEPDMPLQDQVTVPLGTQLMNVGPIALYCGVGGEGYLLAVDRVGPRGATRIDLFDRANDHMFIASIALTSGRSSGLAVTNQPTVAEFPLGVLAVSDAVTSEGGPTFHLFSWKEIASQANLLIDPAWSARPALYRQ